MTTNETITASVSRAWCEAIAAKLRAAFPEVADAIILTGDTDDVVDYDAPPRFFVELRRHGRTVADELWLWLRKPLADELTTAYHRARIAYEVGVIDAPALLTWMRENELA